MNKKITGIGHDIIEIKRVKDAVLKHGKAFLNRIFTAGEQEYCFRYRNPYPSLAGRFAAKEAVAKALKVGIGSLLTWTDIEIKNDKNGQPYVALSEEKKRSFNDPFLLVSISHCKVVASSFVISIQKF